VATCDAGTEIALGLLSLMEVVNIPVSCGSETPLQGEGTFPEEWRVTSTTAANLGLPDGDEPADADAVTLLTSMIESSSENVTILTLGPLTNVGSALQATPELVEKIDMVYIIGGAIEVAGSGISRNNTTAEWNFYLDPFAAQLVFDSGVPITLIPLDATNEVPVTEDFVDNFDSSRATAEADFVYNVLSGNEDGIEGGWYFFWDPFAAAVVTEPGLVSVQREPVIIIREGRHTGRTVIDTSGSEVFIAFDPDAEAFEQLFEDTLNR
jgi:pyrimidine-specific ribonucleoside hydrolase